MGSQKELDDLDIEKHSKIFKKQKVRLYKIKHIIFDFGGVMIEKTFVLKNLLDIFESDLNISIPRSENSYFRKLRRQVSTGIISSREFLEIIFDKYLRLFSFFLSGT